MFVRQRLIAIVQFLAPLRLKCALCIQKHIGKLEFTEQTHQWKGKKKPLTPDTTNKGHSLNKLSHLKF